MPGHTILSNFLEAAKRWPERPALEVEEQTLSYVELLARASAIAEVLAPERQAAHPPLTAVLSHRSVVSFAGILAALLRGHGYLPLSPLFPADRLQHILELTGCVELIVDDTGIGSLERLLDGIDRTLRIVVSGNADAALIRERWSRHEVHVPRSPAAPTKEFAADVDPQSLAYLLFTSGSSGTPKGVQVSHSNVVAFIEQIHNRYNLGTSDRMSQTFDLTFDLSVFDMFVTWSCGGCLCCPSQEHLLHTDEYITGASLSSFFAVPSLGAAMERHGMLRPGAFPSLRLCLFCGEPFPASLAEAWRQAAPNARIENVYGPTELTIFCTAYEWAPERSRDRTENGIVAIGHPLSGMETMVVDESLTPVAAGESGELLMTGPQMTLGYWKDSERSDSAFVVPPGQSEKYYRTGDRVHQAEDDGTFFYLGRLDNQIQVHGYRVELAEIEAALRHVANTPAAVALGWPESEIGYEGIVAFIDDQNADLVAIRRSLAGRLPVYMLPSEIRVIDRFPTNTSGKVDRNALRAVLSDNTEVVPYVQPESPTEQQLAQTWSTILGVDRVGVNDSFFDLGGDSIGAATFINELHSRLGEIFHVTTLFERRTVAEFAAYLRETCPERISQVFGETVDSTAANTVEQVVSPAKIANMRNVFEEQHNGIQLTTVDTQPLLDEVCPAVFILCAPRSGSTLLRIMMAGHPSLFAPPELELASFSTLSERADNLTGLKSWRSEGLVRALMELRASNSEEAKRFVEELTHSGCTTQNMYERLHEWSGRIIVDKTTTYALAQSTLERTEHFFKSAKYVHLVRSPGATIDSYRSSRMEQVFGQSYPYSAREQAEIIWLICNENIRKFLHQVDQEHSLVVTYEQLVVEPERVMRQLCGFIEIDYDERMLQPYEGNKMTDGLHRESRMLGDMRFHEHKKIDAAQAQKSITSELLSTLSSQTKNLAKIFGCEDIAKTDGSRPTNFLRRANSSYGTTIFPFKTDGRKIPLFLLPDASGNPFPYKELAAQFDSDRPVLAFESPDRQWKYDILSIPQQAAHFYVEIRSIQTVGPYCLGGWCMGGAVAFEIARRLEADGETVQSLVLLDVRSPARAHNLIQMRAEKLFARFLLLNCGQAGAWLVDRFGLVGESNAYKFMMCMPEGRSSDAELRDLLSILSRHAFDKQTLAGFSYHELYDELAARLDLGEAYKRELDIAKLTVPSRLHPLRLWHVWFKHTVYFRNFYRPSGVFHGKTTLLLNDTWEQYGWQRFCSKPIDVHRYPIEPFDRGVFAAMMLPSNVALFVKDFIEALGDD